MYAQPEKTLVIVGGGFAGTTLARELERRLPEGWALLLVSEESYTTFNPMLAEVVGAAVFPEHVVAPIRAMLRRTRFVMGQVTRIDRARRTLVCSTLAGDRVIGYEHLVLAFGQRANLGLLPGLAEHALPLKLVGDAMHIRNRVLQRLARMELCADASERRGLGHFVVLGGGFSGVEVAGALADFIDSARRHYPRVGVGETQVSLVHDGPRLLPELPERLGLAAARSLQGRGVQVHLGVRASGVDAGGVHLAGGQRLAAATVVCTIGIRANPLALQLGASVERGRIVTEADSAVVAAGDVGPPTVWAIGDCAATRNGADGRTCPPTAQFAVAQARHLAINLTRRIAGLPTHGFSHRSRGSMATTGHLKGVAEVRGLRLWGLPAWLLWRAYYLWRMPSAGRRLRIWVEWTWGMFFPADITHLRFTRTAEVDAEPSARPVAPTVPTVSL